MHIQILIPILNKMKKITVLVSITMVHISCTRFQKVYLIQPYSQSCTFDVIHILFEWLNYGFDSNPYIRIARAMCKHQPDEERKKTRFMRFARR